MRRYRTLPNGKRKLIRTRNGRGRGKLILPDGVMSVTDIRSNINDLMWEAKPLTREVWWQKQPLCKITIEEIK